MPDPTLRIVLEAIDKASAVIVQAAGNAAKAVSKTGSALDQAGKFVQEHRKQIGIGLTAIGGSITAMAGLSIKAAQDEAVGINQLNQALLNVGTSYEANRVAIESVVAAQQNKTNFSDGAQREALQMLVQITGSYQTALDSLPAALDLAAATGMSLDTASVALGKALTGNTDTLGRYGIKLENGATATDVLTALTARFGGSAEAAVNPMTRLGNQLSNLQETIGAALLPIITKAATVIGAVTAKIMAWAEEHPGLAKVIFMVVGVLGVLMTILGAFLLILPGLIAGISALGVVIALATGPVGLVVLAIAGLIAVGILLATKWDDIWGSIKSGFNAATDFVLGIFESKWGWLLPGGPFVKGLLFLRDHWTEIWGTMRDTFRAVANVILTTVETMVNGIISGINTVADAIAAYIAGAKALLDALPGANPFGNAMQAAINGLRSGIPNITLPRLATGGRIMASGLALVGERGPEVLALPRGATVSPLGGVNVNFYGPVYGMTDFRDRVVEMVRDVRRSGGFGDF